MEPLSLEQISSILEAKKRPTQFFQYKDLPDDPQELARILLSYPPRFLFHTANSATKTGHWTALRRIGTHLYWFSSYGFLPDGELMVSPDMREAPGQHSNKISAALEFLRHKGFTIHYSSVPLQSIDDGTVSCGIWVLMFLTARIVDPEEYEQRLAAITEPERYAEAIYRYEILGEKREDAGQSFHKSGQVAPFSDKVTPRYDSKKVHK